MEEYDLGNEKISIENTLLRTACVIHPTRSLCMYIFDDQIPRLDQNHLFLSDYLSPLQKSEEDLEEDRDDIDRFIIDKLSKIVLDRK